MKTMATALILAAFLGRSLLAEDQKPTREPAPVAALIKLAQSGVGEDVQIAWVEGRPAYETVDVDAIIQLKDAKVSGKVIAAFIRNGGTATAERKSAAAAGEGTVKFLGRYEVPRLSADTPASKSLTLADYEQADRVVSVPSSVQYIYANPYPSYSYGYGLPYAGYYGRYYYPYSRYRSYLYYSHFNDPYCYPRYYSSFGVSTFGSFRLGGTRVGLGFRW
ncbi:MAG: hypothetical protein HY291_03565 [Planctomycetes bacterium]|nr:hypothetical protein [Planctomycetota bacterium]